MKHPILPVAERNAISDLINHIRTDLRLLIQEEIQLARTEMAEKVSRLKRNLIMVVAGAISAYTAAIFLLIAVAAFIALGIQAAGLSPLLSVALGALAVFLLVGVTGYLLVRKGVSALGESLLPEKTLQTLGKHNGHDPKVTLKDSRSSDELRTQVESTQNLLAQDLDSLKARLMPQRLFGVFLVDQIKQHPFRLISFAATTLVTGFQIAKRLRRRAPEEATIRKQSTPL